MIAGLWDWRTSSCFPRPLGRDKDWNIIQGSTARSRGTIGAGGARRPGTTRVGLKIKLVTLLILLMYKPGAGPGFMKEGT